MQTKRANNKYFGNSMNAFGDIRLITKSYKFSYTFEIYLILYGDIRKTPNRMANSNQHAKQLNMPISNPSFQVQPLKIWDYNLNLYNSNSEMIHIFFTLPK